MANAENILREEDELLEDFDLVNEVEETEDVEDADNEHKLTKEEVDEYMRYLDN